jgi:hypothetical protein
LAIRSFSSDKSAYDLKIVAIAVMRRHCPPASYPASHLHGNLVLATKPAKCAMNLFPAQSCYLH